jgi:rubrerythrin
MKNRSPVFPLSIMVLLILPFLFVAGCKKKEETKQERQQKLVTYQNMQVTYGEASKRALWYDRYASAAMKERLLNLASLYRAVSRSEQIHADNFARLLDSAGIQPKQPQIDSVSTGQASQYLKAAVRDENAQLDLYPSLIGGAKIEKVDEAVQQFQWDQKGDDQHLQLFNGIFERGGKVPKVDYFVCTVCGYIITADNVKQCPVCGAPKDKFEKTK